MFIFFVTYIKFKKNDNTQNHNYGGCKFAQYGPNTQDQQLCSNTQITCITTSAVIHYLFLIHHSVQPVLTSSSWQLFWWFSIYSIESKNLSFYQY